MSESENSEMIADIVAEMRGNEFDDPHLNADGIIGARRLAKGWADRIEAAWKRERGNAAAMREALETIVELTAPREGVTSIEPQVHAEAITALSKPPRNCDVGTPEEQEKRYHATGKLYHIPTLKDVMRWERMPYEEGSAK